MDQLRGAQHSLSLALASNANAHFTNVVSNRIFKFKCTFSATIVDTMKRRGWVQVADDSDDWDIYWCDMNQLRDYYVNHGFRTREDHQRIGHFRNCYEISRKNLMAKNLKRLRYRLEKAFGRDEKDKMDFLPTTFVLPFEHKLFLQDFKNQHTKGAFWIIKPAAGAQGKGIFIFQRIRDYFDWRIKFDWTLTEQNQQHLLNQLNNLRPMLIKPKVSKSNFRHNRLNKTASVVSHVNMNENQQQPLQQQQQQQPISQKSQSGIENPLTKTMTEVLLESDREANQMGDTVNTSTLEIPIREGSPRPDIYIVQRYISNPYLIGGKKFDIRFYILVTSYMPLKAWIYRDGFARFSAGQFSLESLQDIYVHLTNVAIQRTAEDYNPEKGSKWSLRGLREYLTARHGKDEVQKLLNNIDVIVIRTLQSAHNLIPQDKHSFEIYGFDVLIDSDMKPWLLEVNASPAFTPSNEEDYRLKCALIDDTAHVLDLEGRLLGYEKRVGGYDLLWNDGPIYADPLEAGHLTVPDEGPKLNSFLGCINDRVDQLREVFRTAQLIKEAEKLLGNNTLILEPPPRPKVKDNRFRLPDYYPISANRTDLIRRTRFAEVNGVKLRY